MDPSGVLTITMLDAHRTSIRQTTSMPGCTYTIGAAPACHIPPSRRPRLAPARHESARRMQNELNTGNRPIYPVNRTTANDQTFDCGRLAALRDQIDPKAADGAAAAAAGR